MTARGKHGTFAARCRSYGFCAAVVGAACVHGCTYVAAQVNFERMCQSGLFADNCRGMCQSDAAAIFRDGADLMLVVSLWDSSDLTPFLWCLSSQEMIDDDTGDNIS